MAVSRWMIGNLSSIFCVLLEKGVAPKTWDPETLKGWWSLYPDLPGTVAPPAKETKFSRTKDRACDLWYASANKEIKAEATKLYRTPKYHKLSWSQLKKHLLWKRWQQLPAAERRSWMDKVDKLPKNRWRVKGRFALDPDDRPLQVLLDTEKRGRRPWQWTLVTLIPCIGKI